MSTLRLRPSSPPHLTTLNKSVLPRGGVVLPVRKLFVPSDAISLSVVAFRIQTNPCQDGCWTSQQEVHLQEIPDWSSFSGALKKSLWLTLVSTNGISFFFFFSEET
uniref:Uncharacterized protein n=1 Tax=Compsopogon caeruleus TaxID=31354 RepID=A0A7S1XBS2_9RHOD|mmetsp:Transcript_12467/g.25369  ORF Transcript_12467/g.25369 Transcript_12467/m.25369 type:complete len:106 (+) Transcript_12467:235-552(+)